MKQLTISNKSIRKGNYTFTIEKTFDEKGNIVSADIWRTDRNGNTLLYKRIK